MRNERRIAAVFAAAVVLGACSELAPAESTVAAPVPEVTVTERPTSTSPSPTSTSISVVPVGTTVLAGAEVVTVPTQPPPEIDGVLGLGEWDGAAVFSMSNGALVGLMQADATLYLAVGGDEVGSVNVVIASNDEVWILHSSAALGSALYVPGSDDWQLSHGFRWCCRDGNDDSGRLGLLDEEGWQANIGYTGDPGIVEYQIEIPWQRASLAISAMRADGETGFWPTDLSEEARVQLLGQPPPTQLFNTEEWSIVEGLRD